MASERFRQQFIIENRPGAGGNIATGGRGGCVADGTRCSRRAYKTPATRRCMKSSNTFYATRAGREHQPRELRHGGAIIVSGKSVRELIAYAKANPGKLNMRRPARNRAAYGRRLVQVIGRRRHGALSYRGSPPAFADLLAGQVQVSSVRCLRHRVTSKAASWPRGLAHPPRPRRNVAAGTGPVLNDELLAEAFDSHCAIRRAAMSGAPQRRTRRKCAPAAPDRLARKPCAKWLEGRRRAQLNAGIRDAEVSSRC